MPFSPFNRWGLPSPFNRWGPVGAVSPLAAYAVNGVSPALYADFDDDTYPGTTFGDLFTISRASTATYVDSSAVLRTASSGAARENHHIHNGSEWVNAGVLLEPAATNLFLHSEDFSNAVWSPRNVTVTTNQAVSPDGETTADEINPNANTDASLRYTTSLSGSTQYTVSVYVKASAGSWFRIRNIATGYEAWYNVSTGVVGSDVGTGTHRIENAGNGWYRCISTSTTAASVGTNLIDVAAASADNTRVTSGGETLYVFGAQLETGGVATSYIATGASTATRAADVLTVDNPLPTYTDTVCLVVKGYQTGQGVPLRWFGDASNYITHTINGDGDVVFEQAESGTVDNVEATTAYTLGVNVPFAIAARHGATYIQGAASGTAVAANTTPTALFDGTSTDIRLAYSGGPVVISELGLWVEDIAEAGLEAASTVPFA